jgi:hypothetical protein
MGTFSDNGSAHEHLIRDLASDLEPVGRLRPPTVRAIGWLIVVAVVAIALARFADLPALESRLSASPDMWLAVTGSIMTAVLAALAAFQLSLPDANRAWALLPLPATLLWVIASGLGCLRAWLVPGTHVAELNEARDCLIFIIGISIPLSVLMFVMLRRACSLQPGLTAAIAGLATAAAAATLLNFFHPFDVAATDLAVHACAVALVIVANWAFSGRLLGIAS